MSSGFRILAGFLLSALAACSTPPPPQGPGPLYSHESGSSDDSVEAIRQAIIDTALSLIGSPYRYGGMSPDGFDCSGFVRYVYKDSVDIDLPRVSSQQLKLGQAISKVNLRAADLIFFRIGGLKSLHVGIYIGKGNFIHAPSSGGVVNIQDLGERYWERRFYKAKRII